MQTSLLVMNTLLALATCHRRYWMDSAHPAIPVEHTAKYTLTISPQIGYGLRMFPCHTHVLMTHCSSPILVQSPRETVAMLPTLHCAGTGYRHSSMEIVPMIGNKGYMYDISLSVIVGMKLKTGYTTGRQGFQRRFMGKRQP